MFTRDKVIYLLLLIVVCQAQATEIKCPTGYIPVPGNSELGTKDFCVAKYEMKKSASGKAVSNPDGQPWVNQTASEVFAACQAVKETGFNGKFQLITNPQWMTIARNIEGFAGNWSGGNVGSGHIGRGWSAEVRETPSDGFSNTGISPNAYKSCEYNTGADSCSASGKHWQKRSHNLSNGEIVWDMAGHLEEWVDWHGNDNVYTHGPTDGAAKWQTITTLSGSLTRNDVGPKGNFTHAHNMGRWYSGGGSSVLRGAGFHGGDYVGIYFLNLSYGANNRSQWVGFRCTYLPDGNEAKPNVAPVAKADSFSLKDNAGVTELDILANDNDEDKASLSVTITNQSGLGGSATVSGQKLSYTPKVGYAGEDWVEYRLTDKQGSTSSVVKVTLTLSHAPAKQISCPTGYIPVPGNSELGTEDFCVAKYEMKKSGSGKAVSQAAGLPWGGLAAAEAFNQCQAVTAAGFKGKFQLISNPQWMTLARDLESVNTNWSGGVVGNGMFARGHSDANPNVSLSVSNDSDPYDQTGNNSGQAANSGWEQKRRNQLTNGEYIWDLGGNVHEFVDWHLNDNSYSASPSGCKDAGGSAGWNEMNEAVTACSAGDKDIKPKNTSFTSAKGMGRWYGGNAGVAFRGGKMSNGVETGIFTLAMFYGKANGDVGFRCSYTLADSEQFANKAPTAVADSFVVDGNKGQLELDVIANDKDEDKASVSISITNQSGLGGSATVSGQKLSYTPKVGFVGDDWVEYRLTDKQGLTSNIVRVSIASIVSASSSIFANGLVVEYLFEDPTNPAKDTSVSAKHATSKGTPTLADGKVGRALQVDELTDVLDGVPGFNKGQMTSFNLWFKTSSASKGENFMQQSYWQGNHIWELFPKVDMSGRLSAWAVAWNGAGRNDMEMEKTGYNFRDNQWHMLTIITDGNAGKAYLDGVFIAEDKSSNGPGSWTHNQASSMGKIGGACIYGFNNCKAGQGFFDGLIDNYRMYNRALSELEIQQLYQELPGKVNQPPVTVTDSFTVVENNGVVALDILANDWDEDKSGLSIVITNQGSEGGTASASGQTLNYTPKAGYEGEDWIEYKVTDGAGLSSNVSRVKLHHWARVPSGMPEQGLAVEYRFENASQPGQDTSTHDKHATSKGSPTVVAGKYGQALVIDELTDVLDNVPGFNKGQMTSFNLWFKTNKGGYLMQQSYWNNDNAPPMWEMVPEVKSENGKAQAWALGLINSSSRNDMELSYVGNDFRDNLWHMLTVITDGNAGKMYIDGVLVAEDSSSNGPGSWSATQSKSMLKLGGACLYGHTGCNQGKNSFSGLIDNYRMYNRALNVQEIRQLYLNDSAQVLRKPIARADSYSFTNEKSHALTVLNNDWDDDKPSVSINITSQKPDTGTVTVSGQAVTYTPKANYVGADWFEYQLTDKHGLKSAIARVTLDVQKYKPKAGMATVSPRQNIIDEKKQLITITHNTPNAKVWFQFHNTETGQITDFIEYTNPFYIYDSARIMTVVKGDDYLDSELGSKDYWMCKQDSCGRTPYQKQLEWRDNSTEKVVTKIKVNQPVKILWDIERVRYCEETTPGQVTAKERTPNGATPEGYTFAHIGVINSFWQCFASNHERSFPDIFSKDKYRALPLTVEKLDAPVNLTHSQTDSTLTLNWDKVNYASHYQLQYQKAGESSWQTKNVNGLSTSLALTTGDYNLQLSGCIPSTCANVGNITTKTISIEKLAAPTNLTYRQTGSTVNLSWSKVDNASHYQLQYQKAGESSWQTKIINGLSTNLALAAGDYKLKLSGCISSTCDGVGNIATKTIKVADNPLVIRKLQWQTNPITVGETATLEWDIGNALECFVDGRLQASSTNASHTTPAIYQAGTVDITLACSKTAGGNKETIAMPQDKSLKVNKLPAPSNLRKQ